MADLNPPTKSYSSTHRGYSESEETSSTSKSTDVYDADINLNHNEIQNNSESEIDHTESSESRYTSLCKNHSLKSKNLGWVDTGWKFKSYHKSLMTLSKSTSSLIMITKLQLLLKVILLLFQFNSLVTQVQASPASFSSYQLFPIAQPQAGMSFEIEVYGTNADIENNRLMIIDYSNGANNCMDANKQIVTPSSHETVDQILSSSNCNLSGAAATKLRCGPFIVYKQIQNLGICICAKSVTLSDPDCTTKDQYIHDFNSKFNTRGPIGNQQWGYQVLVPKQIEILGNGFSSSDKILVLKKDDYPTCRHYESLVPTQTGNIMSTQAINFDGESDSSTSDTAIRWDMTQFSEVTKFIICWCGSTRQSCSQTDQYKTYAGEVTVNGKYKTYAGEVTVNGPYSNQQIYATLGMSSTLPITGIGLQLTDRIRIVHSTNVICGGGGASNHIMHVQQGATGAPFRAEPSSIPSLAEWTNVRINVAGTYRICWCGGMHSDSMSCQSDSQFNYDLGTVEVTGPDQGQVFDPVMGVPTRVTVTGQGLHEGDRIIIINGDCGSSGMDKSDSNILNKPDSRQADYVSSTKLSWYKVVFQKRDNYRLCWCARASLNCDTAEEFGSEVAIFSPRGPGNLNGGPFSISSTKGVPFDLRVTGNSVDGDATFFSYSKIRILRAEQVPTCGSIGSSAIISSITRHICWDYSECKESGVYQPGPTVTDGTSFAEWSPISVRDTGSYLVCYCAGGNNGYNDERSDYSDCDKDLAFGVPVGTVTITGIGQAETPWVCTQEGNEHCVIGIDITHTSGASISDKIWIVQQTNDNACGKSQRADPNTFTLGTEAQAIRIYNETNTVTNIPTGRRLIEFDIGVSNVGGTFLVCYCQSYQGCDDPVDYHQYGGLIQIKGVTLPSGAENQLCFVNQDDCKVRVYGTLLNAGSRLTLIDGNSQVADCGKSGLSVLSEQFLNNEKLNYSPPDLYGFRGSKGITGSYEFLEFNLGETSNVGKYQLCFCDDTLVNNGECEYLQYFFQYSGKLYVRGVSNYLSISCEQGGECSFPLVGEIMTSSDRVTVLKIIQNPAGTDITPDNQRCGGVDIVSPNDGDFSPGNTIGPHLIEDNVDVLDGQARATYKFSATSSPGKYRLCYCADLAINSGSGACDNLSQFKLEVGSLRVMGVISDVQMSVLPTKNVVSVKVESTVAGARYGCVAAISRMYESRRPTINDITKCNDMDIIRGQKTVPEAMFPLCVSTVESTELSKVGFNHIHIPIPSHDSPEWMEAKSYRSGSQVPHYHVWCYSTSMCENQLCVSPSNDDGLMIPVSDTDNPYVQDFLQDQSKQSAKPMDVGITVSPLTPEVLSEARLKIVSPLEEYQYNERFGQTTSLLGMFGFDTGRRELENSKDAKSSKSDSKSNHHDHILIDGGHISDIKRKGGLDLKNLPMIVNNIDRDGNVGSPIMASMIRDRVNKEQYRFSGPDGIKQQRALEKMENRYKSHDSKSESSKTHSKHNQSKLNDKSKSDKSTTIIDSHGRHLQDNDSNGNLNSNDDGPASQSGSSTTADGQTTTTTTTTDPCNRLALTQNVESGLTCNQAESVGPSGKCEPPATNNGINSDLTWTNIVISSSGIYDMCYCDRHVDQRCLGWSKVGNLKINGPMTGAPVQYGNPGSQANIVVQGLGLSKRDRIHIINEESICGKAETATEMDEPVSGQNATISRRLIKDREIKRKDRREIRRMEMKKKYEKVLKRGNRNSEEWKELIGKMDERQREIVENSDSESDIVKQQQTQQIKRLLLETLVDKEISHLESLIDQEVQLQSSKSSKRNLGVVWTSLSPQFQNSTMLQWSMTFYSEKVYKICYCGGENTCSDHKEFTTYVGNIEIAPRVDCVLSDFYIVSSCDKTCGGGMKTKRRRVVTPSSGGGLACPANAESLISEICNPDPCPLAKIEKAESVPASIIAGVPFQIRLSGNWLNPEEDRILLIDPSYSCGKTQTYLAGASCTQPGGTINSILCGDGSTNIRINEARSFRVCICDGSAALVRSEDGSGFELAGALDSEGTMASGCSDARNYLLVPENPQTGNSGIAEGAIMMAGHVPSPPEPDTVINIGALELSVPVFVVLLILLSLMFVVAPFAWILRSYIEKRRMRQAQLKYQQQIAAETGMQFEPEPQKSGILGKLGKKLGMSNNDDKDDVELLALKNEADAAQTDASLLAWDEYYQSLGYPPGTAYTILGPALRQNNNNQTMPGTFAPPGSGAGVAEQGGGLMALANSSYDPNDIFGGYGQNGYGLNQTQSFMNQSQSQFTQPPPIPGLLALGYDGGPSPPPANNSSGNGQAQTTQDFLNTSYSADMMPKLPVIGAMGGGGGSNNVDLGASFADKVRRTQNAEKDNQEGSAPGTPKGGKDGELSENENNNENNKSMKGRRARPSAIGILGSAAGRPDDDLNDGGGGAELSSPKSSKIKKEKEMLENSTRMLEQQLKEQAESLDREQKMKEKQIEEKLNKIREHRTKTLDGAKGAEQAAQFATKQAEMEQSQQVSKRDSVNSQSTDTSNAQTNKAKRPPPPARPGPMSPVAARRYGSQKGQKGGPGSMFDDEENNNDNTQSETKGGKGKKGPPPPPGTPGGLEGTIGGGNNQNQNNNNLESTKGLGSTKGMGKTMKGGQTMGGPSPPPPPPPPSKSRRSQEGGPGGTNSQDVGDTMVGTASKGGGNNNNTGKGAPPSLFEQAILAGAGPTNMPLNQQQEPTTPTSQSAAATPKGKFSLRGAAKASSGGAAPISPTRANNEQSNSMGNTNSMGMSSSTSNNFNFGMPSPNGGQGPGTPSMGGSMTPSSKGMKMMKGAPGNPGPPPPPGMGSTMGGKMGGTMGPGGPKGTMLPPGPPPGFMGKG